MIKRKIVVDDNLLHLQNVLFDLKSYSFDDEITKLLDDLRKLVDYKLYSNLDLRDFNVVDVEHIIKYYIKPNCKNDE